jgi:hypothetical protein
MNWRVGCKNHLFAWSANKFVELKRPRKWIKKLGTKIVIVQRGGWTKGRNGGANYGEGKKGS